jgi:hypothetical protein
MCLGKERHSVLLAGELLARALVVPGIEGVRFGVGVLIGPQILRWQNMELSLCAVFSVGICPNRRVCATGCYACRRGPAISDANRRLRALWVESEATRSRSRRESLRDGVSLSASLLMRLGS